MSAARGMARAGFVVLDGIDGCGKSTQAARLVEWLRQRDGAQPLHVREPGSTAVGERVRALLLERGIAIAPATETLLFAAARRQLLEECIAPALSAGRPVVCERFHASTFAYQAVAGELEEDAVLALLESWATIARPDLELILDLELDQALARRGAASDRIEEKSGDYPARVLAGYRRYCERIPRARLVDAAGSEAEVFERILELCRDVL